MRKHPMCERFMCGGPMCGHPMTERLVCDRPMRERPDTVIWMALIEIFNSKQQTRRKTRDFDVRTPLTSISLRNHKTYHNQAKNLRH